MVFFSAPSTPGAGINKWVTTAATTLASTFHGATKMDGDLTKWDVSKVTTMANTFTSAAAFKGIGLTLWITAAVTTLADTFYGASAFNGDMSYWDTAKVTTLANTFNAAQAFDGRGINKWSVAKVTTMAATFTGITSAFLPCNKNVIHKQWTATANPGGAAFTSAYATTFNGVTCIAGSIRFQDISSVGAFTATMQAALKVVLAACHSPVNVGDISLVVDLFIVREARSGETPGVGVGYLISPGLSQSNANLIKAGIQTLIITNLQASTIFSPFLGDLNTAQADGTSFNAGTIKGWKMRNLN